MKQEWADIAKTVDGRLHELLNAPAIPKELIEAMSYSVFAGGKRLRPILAMLGNRLFGGDPAECLDIACAVEMIHTYSLIHDDLPAMDDDTMRRGKPTNHVVFGEAKAILAGDGLLNYAFEVMLSNAARYSSNLKNHLKAISEVAAASGPSGMVAGQCADIDAEGAPLDADKLYYTHKRKTGAMISASLLSGALLCSPDQNELAALRKYSECVGLVFQIVDDVLDETGDASVMGKTLKKDAAAGKLTFVGLYGVEGAMDTARGQTSEAVDALAIFGSRGSGLAELAFYLLERKK